MTLTLTRAQLKTLRDHCNKCWPEEACALLVGEPGEADDCVVSRVVLSRNIAADRQRFFEIDPGVRIGLEKELRGERENIIGVFHSHPNGPAKPSKSDEKMVIERQFIWLIAAAEKGDIVDLNAYLPSAQNGFLSVQLNITKS